MNQQQINQAYKLDPLMESLTDALYKIYYKKSMNLLTFILKIACVLLHNCDDLSRCFLFCRLLS
ncbi:hypothetical protein FC24_GL001780 [Loigolactobacillus rennini DSM 20253]|uniref:Uncharacterized protein n=1 Tax=Loigolactobacillus rennini DSM 20253 TaxID=1423796 RepID=A0A0R2D7N4_9LACO|nr:hypothetical protein FC24_GL001780 [Loigolactobacillus rennini DSM 20253]